MDIIKTGIGLSKTIRNVGRFKEIVLIFAKHGFDEFIQGSVQSFIPDFVVPKSKENIREDLSEKDWQEVMGRRLRFCFEELGPAFIKFGQLLASREDIFDSSFTDEMKILRDKVKPIPFSELRSEVESSLGKKVEECFSYVNDVPVGTASIGSVYEGELLTGEKVVLKVKRPGIEKIVETDFSILKFLCVQAEKVSEEVRYVGVSRIVNDFEASLVNELNFNIELLNLKRFKKAIVTHDAQHLLYVPEVFEEFSGRDLLVMEKIEGIPFSNAQEILEKGEQVGQTLEEAYRTFLKTFLQDGFFHADLHGGNFFLLDDGKIGLIDFGLMGTLSSRGRKSFIALTYAMLTFNYENVVYEFLDVAEYKKIPDVDELINDVRSGLSPYLGLTAKQIDFSRALKIVIKTLKKHEIFLPREWFIVFRAIMTLDGVGRSIEQDFDVYSMLEEDIHDLIKGGFSKEEVVEEAVWAARDLLSFSRLIPRHLKWFLKDWSKNKYKLDLNLSGYEKSFNDLSSSVVFLSLIVLSCTFLITGSNFISHSSQEVSLSEISLLTWFFWGLSFMTICFSFFKLSRSQK